MVVYINGAVSLNPITISIPAKHDNGICFSMDGINITESTRITPCVIVDALDFAPALMFAELLTITDVMGNPPNNPDMALAVPCAFNSRLSGVILR
jgi:hypothetical protein